MTKLPTTASSKSIYKNQFVEIKVDTLSLDGNSWEYVYFVKPFGDGAGVVPIDATGMYLVHQYRYPMRDFFWQIPMGMMDEGSDEIETARRELLEETGITAKKLTPIGSLVGEPGMSNQEVHIFVGEGLSFGEKNTEAQEIGMHLKHFTFAEIDESIRNGTIRCGFTLGAILLFKNNYLWTK